VDSFQYYEYQETFTQGQISSSFFGSNNNRFVSFGDFEGYSVQKQSNDFQ